MEFDAWSVDTRSGHCANSTGLHACFDPNPTPSGAIKAVGPFGNRLADTDLVSEQMLLATIAIEREVDGYVVWGEYHDRPDYRELQIAILGSVYGFLPFLALRWSLFASSRYGLEVRNREWKINERVVSHRSNGLQTKTPSGEVDLEVMHPDSCQEQLRVLQVLASRVFRNSKLRLVEQVGGWSRLG